MFTLMILALALAAQDSSGSHVRSTEPTMLAHIDAGLSRSATFGGLIATLNATGVMVYLDPHRARQALGGYLAHTIVAQERYRDLRIAVEGAESERRLVALLAHERLLASGPNDRRRERYQRGGQFVVNAALGLRASGRPRWTHALAGGTQLQRPAPLTAAIRLLGWFGDDVPRIEIVGTKPPDATATVEAWVRFNEDGSAMPIIYLRTDTEVYRAAAGEDYQALVRLAGILAHERWHLRHGRGEIGAYTAQLAAMEYLGAHSMHLAVVRRALRMVEQQAKRRAPRK